MAAKLVLAPEAEFDVAEAYSWYESRRTGLGEEFLSCVDACIAGLCRAPERCPAIHESYRRALVRRFPYAIFYESDEHTITAYCVFHTAREPEKWRQRLP
jgi:plasmid stabilization system protein ParE